MHDSQHSAAECGDLIGDYYEKEKFRIFVTTS